MVITSQCSDAVHSCNVSTDTIYQVLYEQELLLRVFNPIRGDVESNFGIHIVDILMSYMKKLAVITGLNAESMEH
ncbi:hypothetical protein LWI29_026414 [Acer saccharum]|uniref:Uncharacterized protein n=1 Tax=Acer saccharum TaxID=4024 RepID=A0AA39RJE4_ACESA|nr:hypothetical protein LWI29_026414 [Acer saccharum]KAK1575586.1 hypothetical protein Q3G72_006713 [Acer saccharum]